MLRELCKIYTDLTDSDILVLENVEKILPVISKAMKADVFIDCLTDIPNVAIVVAEAKPSQEESLYTNTVVGDFALGENEPAALRTLETGVPSRDLIAISQENHTIRQCVEPIRNNNEQVIGVLIIEQDITKYVNNNLELKNILEAREKLAETLNTLKNAENTIIDHVNEAIIMFNSNGIATYCNPEAQQLYKKLGYQDELVGLAFNNITLSGMSFSGMIHNNFVSVEEVKIGKLSLRVKYVAMEDKKKPLGMIMLINDVTAVKEKEMELVSKSVAISEIHHRVKNNLQTIASLLRLQSRRIYEENAKKAFNESISRILSIAITHELLAQKGLDNVDLRTILEKMKLSSIEYAIPPGKDIKIHILGERTVVNSDKATSIALVVNELLQNSIEHGFIGRDEGEIKISIQKGGFYTNVIIEDNGVGFDTEKIKKKSLGLSIVSSIVKERLYGSLQIISNTLRTQGTEVRFNFKNE